MTWFCVALYIVKMYGKIKWIKISICPLPKCIFCSTCRIYNCNLIAFFLSDNSNLKLSHVDQCRFLGFQCSVFMTWSRGMGHMLAKCNFGGSFETTCPLKSLHFYSNFFFLISGRRDVNKSLKFLNNGKQEFVTSFGL